MTTNSQTNKRAKVSGRLATLAAAALLASCNWSDVIEVVDPDVINPTALNSPAAAASLRNGVLLRLAQATTGGESVVLLGGLLADEWRSGDTFVQRNDTDQRTLAFDNNTFLAGAFRAPMRVLVEAGVAAEVTAQFQPTPRSNIGLMYAVAAYSANIIGESFCNGIPYSRIVDGNIDEGEPEPYENSFVRAITFSDSALLYQSGPTADSALVRNLAAVVRGRALINRGLFAEAAQAVAGVPTSFAFRVFHSNNSTSNQNWALNENARRYVLANLEGGNGLPFRTANDPRIPWSTGTGSRRLAFDSETPFFFTTLFQQFGSVALATGIEARLIQAEAALRADQPEAALVVLNQLRLPAVGGVNGLAPLADPGTAAGRVDLLMRERAFWMFGTGHRLGDMRRLIRQYGRTAESVFPTGDYHKGGGVYGSSVVIPISVDEQNNAKFTSCTNLLP